MPRKRLVNTAQHTNVTVTRSTLDVLDTKSTKIVEFNEFANHFRFDFEIIKHWHGTALGVFITKTFVEIESKGLPC